MLTDAELDKMSRMSEPEYEAFKAQKREEQ
jgi:hypothetical protein